MTLLDKKIVDTLTAEQWLGVIAADEGGVWPACCANVSQVRERLVDLLTVGGHPQMVVAARLLEGEHDDHLDDSSPLVELRDALVDELDEHHPGWRDEDLVAERAIADDFWLGAMLTGEGGDPVAPKTYAHWGPALVAAGEFMESLPTHLDSTAALELFARLKGLLNDLRVAGAPTGVVQELFGVWRADLSERLT